MVRVQRAEEEAKLTASANRAALLAASERADALEAELVVARGAEASSRVAAAEAQEEVTAMRRQVCT